MKYLGIDYGAKRIGIATSDADGGFAFPKETIPNDATAIDRIYKLILDNAIDEVVIGDARSSGGIENTITHVVESFAHALAGHIKKPVHTSWEAWSSVEAARFAPKGSEHNDAAAAAIILQRYLDTHQIKEDDEWLS
jgi:putative holliday junction resolvase